MGKRTRKNSYRNKPSETDSPFYRPSLGPFTSTDIELVGKLVKDAALEGVEAGGRQIREALAPKELPLWIKSVYSLILIFAVVVLFIPPLSEYRQAAIGFLFGQGSLVFLVIKSRLQSE